MNYWYVIETPCWPASWKVTCSGPWGREDFGSNDTSNFFRSAAKAQAEADKRNKQRADRFRDEAAKDNDIVAHALTKADKDLKRGTA